MRGLVAVLCAVTAHALGETCSTLWSKLARLGCRPQDLQLSDHLETLTLSDGGVVNLRCTEDHAFCLRVDRATELSQPSSLPLTHEPFSSVAHSAMTAAAAATGSSTAAAAARALFLPVPAVAATISSAPSVMVGDSAATAAASSVIVGDPFTAPARRRLHSSPTAEPSPAPTFLPSPAPSVSPVPTTAEITTWAQLRNAVADPAVSTINVSVDIAFPAQIEVTRNVTIVGVGGPDTALRDAGTPLARLFQVTGGALLRIESLHLVNNASSLPFAGCSYTSVPPIIECAGGVIYAYQAHVELVGCTMRDSRGGFRGGGMMLIESSGLVVNCTFTRLEAVYGAAIYPQFGSSLVIASSVFHDNEAHASGIVCHCAFHSSFFSVASANAKLISLMRAQTSSVLWICVIRSSRLTEVVRLCGLSLDLRRSRGSRSGATPEAVYVKGRT